MKEKVNKKVHLCILAPWAYGLLDTDAGAVYGGAEINLYYLAKYLGGKKEYQVTFLIGDYGQSETVYRDGICFKKIKNMIYEKKDKKEIGSEKFLRKFINGIVKERHIAREFMNNSYDIILVTTASLLLTRAVLWGKYMGNSKIIFRFANDTDTRQSYFRKTTKNRIKDKLYWWGIHHVDQLVCQTKDQRRVLENIGNYQVKIIENAFPIGSQEQKDIPSGKILWVARADKAKRPELFLKLAIKVPEEKFMMIIPGNNPLKESILNKGKDIPNLEVIDYVAFDKIQTYFNHAKLFVNTSLVEGFPNTFIQAGTAGIPILSYCIDPDNIIETHHIGYVCNDSLKNAAHFIRSLREEEQKVMGENNFQYVNEYHNIEKAVQKYENIIAKLYYKSK